MKTTHWNIQQHHHRNTTKCNTFYILNYDVNKRQFRTTHGGRFRLQGTETHDSRLPVRLGPIATSVLFAGSVEKPAISSNPWVTESNGTSRNFTRATQSLSYVPHVLFLPTAVVKCWLFTLQKTRQILNSFNSSGALIHIKIIYSIYSEWQGGSELFFYGYDAVSMVLGFRRFGETVHLSSRVYSLAKTKALYSFKTLVIDYQVMLYIPDRWNPQLCFTNVCVCVCVWKVRI